MHDPALVRNLAFVQRFLVELRGAYHDRGSIPSFSIPATSFESDNKAADAVEVIYDANSREHRWYLRESDHVSDDQCIERIKSSKYFKSTNYESLCRTILNIIFCDRLNILNNRKSELYLNSVFGVTLSTQSKRLHKTISGRADWVLGHGNLRSTLDPSLIVMEAKRTGAADLALPQLIIYLAAVQDARKSRSKMNSSVFGLLTDSTNFRFVYLDPSRKLFVSKPHEWLEEKAKIIQWIDKILEDSIQASPHTTPFKWQYQFGSAAKDFDLVEGENDRGYEIIQREGYVVARYAEEIGDSDDEEAGYSEVEEVGHPDSG
ncbi:uncharacterized protein K441DRAFT_533611 [Cenococcum geophilum 1.58]|uniref:uncharacterized protein n=1 Tax=Cenococcum geophilum 1.58 TaxID=794803 RepID=UPI00358F7F27|nr:hypothetical protein K441DRAFT_533611 [Cenococcum geophilum 1.58]